MDRRSSTASLELEDDDRAAKRAGAQQCNVAAPVVVQVPKAVELEAAVAGAGARAELGELGEQRAVDRGVDAEAAIDGFGQRHVVAAVAVDVADGLDLAAGATRKAREPGRSGPGRTPEGSAIVSRPAVPIDAGPSWLA